MDNIVGCVGPLARSARDLALFCRVMSEAESWVQEHQVLHIPWNDDIAIPRKLCIGILWDDGVVHPHPPITSGLMNVKEALIKAGHEVIDYEPMEHQAAWDLLVKLYLLDGGEEYWATMREAGEPPVPMTEWILSHAKGRKPYPVSETWKLNVQREQFRARALQHWNNTRQRTSSGRPVDAILAPIAPTLASRHDCTRWWGYSSYWNLVDYPAAVFPIGRFSAADHRRDTANSLPSARNDVEEFVRGQWDPKGYNNAPVSLQLIGRRLNEEKLLKMLDAVEKAIGKMK